MTGDDVIINYSPGNDPEISNLGISSQISNVLMIVLKELIIL